MSHVLVCKKHPVAKLRHLMPDRYIEHLEQNQRLAHCCRHPENHHVEAWKSKEEEAIPDVYIFHCTCGKKHIRFCVGSGERPFWDVR